MPYRPIPLALCGLAAFGLAACDAADDPAPAPDSATGVFDATLFADAGQLITVSNQPDANDNDRAVRFRNPDALAPAAAFFREKNYDVLSFQQAKAEEGLVTGFGFASSTSYFGTFDAPGVGRVASFSRQGAPAGQFDGLSAPKGFDIFRYPGDDTIGDLLVADFGTGVVEVFFAEGLGGGPIATLNSSAGGSVWDVEIDSEQELAFVARTNGFISVYVIGDVDPIDEFQVMSAGGATAVNNHGVIFDSESNTLIVSDVGLASSADDGALHVLDYDPGVGSGGAPVMARATYAGPNTMLGNPVDIEGSGADVFVAEKANGGGRMLRFIDALNATGTLDVAPDVMTAAVKNPESVAKPGEPNDAPDEVRIAKGRRWVTK